MALKYIVVRDDASTNYYVASLNVDDVTGQVMDIDTNASIVARTAGISLAKLIRNSLNA